MDINALFPGKYLKAGAEIEDGGAAVLTIKSLAIEKVGNDEDAENKPVVYFAECEKGLVLNKTNAKSIAGLYGNNTDGWVGKRITIVATDVQFGDKMMLGLRVRSQAPKAEAATGLKAQSGASPF